MEEKLVHFTQFMQRKIWSSIHVEIILLLFRKCEKERKPITFSLCVNGHEDPKRKPCTMNEDVGSVIKTKKPPNK